MNITDGLHHYGEVSVNDDINYYHTGLGKRVNKLKKGFWVGSRFYEENGGFTTYKTTVTAERNGVAACPLKGVYYAVRNNRFRIFNREMEIIHETSYGETNYKGIVTINKKGECFLVNNDSLRLIRADGSVKAVNDTLGRFVQIVSGVSDDIHSAAIDDKKDIIVFSYGASGGRRMMLVRQSTLEVLKLNFYTPVGDGYLTFTKDGRLILHEHGQHNFKVLTINYNDYSYTSVTRALDVSSAAHVFLGLTKEGKALFACSNPRHIKAYDIDTGIGEVICVPPSGIVYYDFDDKYIYGVGNSDNRVNITDLSTGENLITIAFASNTTFPPPTQSKGKLPICEEFW